MGFFEHTVSNDSRPSWDKYFMDMAIVVSSRSPDPKKKVGAVLVDSRNRIISTGYNAFPAGFLEKDVDWTDRDFVKDGVIHAEVNTILYSMSKYDNAVLYTTLSPCSECFKIIAGARIKKIYYKEEYNKNIEKSKKLAKMFEIEMIKI